MIELVHLSQLKVITNGQQIFHILLYHECYKILSMIVEPDSYLYYIALLYYQCLNHILMAMLPEIYSFNL